ncbi:hypothetical protein CYY_007825 [Polysphondylium violaceum]|uniref:Uncharacterized protein n=1 Tax=Polysphondylium violaceum TaxID=133409 RepID=A0A8J4PP36_9MYCE|nr:hypothetical protein CYY_007825 [Polysphondylium violaceum]
MQDIYYKQIFNNIYLSTKIYNFIHQIQCNHYSLKYDDVVDIGWMHKNNHKGLLKEKLNNSNNNYLYINPSYLFSTIANNDTGLFISLFERYKYQILNYYHQNTYKLLGKLNNVEVVKYLFDRGYGTNEIRLKIDRVDVDIISYYKEKKWLAGTNLLRNYLNRLRKYNQLPKMDLQEKIQVILSHSIQFSYYHLQTIIDNPIPHLLEPLTPLLHEELAKQNNYKLKSTKLTLDIQKAQHREDQLIQFINKCYNNSSNSNRQTVFNHIVEGITKQESIRIWYDWILKGDQEFYSCWEKNLHRLRITSDRIYYHTTHDIDTNTSSQELGQDNNVVDIGPIIRKSCYINTSVEIIRFIYQQGYQALGLDNVVGDNIIVRNIYYKELVLVTKAQDKETIVELSRIVSGTTSILSKMSLIGACCRLGHAENLDYYLGEFKDDLSRSNINDMFGKSRKHPHLVRVFYKHRFVCPIDNNPNALYIHCWQHQHSDVNLFDRVFMLKSPIVYSIENNDYPSFKYLINNVNTQLDISDERLQESIAHCPNLNIIHYINNHRSTCLPTSNPIGIKHFFAQVFEKAFDCQDFNPALINYLINQNCIDTSTLAPQQLNLFESLTQFGKVRIPHLNVSFNYFAYLVDQYPKHKSIDPLIPAIVQSPHHIEYVFKNQQRFHTKPHFGSISARLKDYYKSKENDNVFGYFDFFGIEERYSEKMDSLFQY